MAKRTTDLRVAAGQSTMALSGFGHWRLRQQVRRARLLCGGGVRFVTRQALAGRYSIFVSIYYIIVMMFYARCRNFLGAVTQGLAFSEKRP